MHYNDNNKTKALQREEKQKLQSTKPNWDYDALQWYNKTKALQREEKQKLLSTKPNWDYDALQKAIKNNHSTEAKQWSRG